MSQTIFADLIPGDTSGTELAGHLNAFKAAILSGFSGTSRPTQLAIGGMWVDTTDPEVIKLKIYDGVDDNIILELTVDSGVMNFPGSPAVPGLFSGATDPESEDGLDNSFYLNTASKVLFGPKGEAGTTEIFDRDFSNAGQTGGDDIIDGTVISSGRLVFDLSHPADPYIGYNLAQDFCGLSVFTSYKVRIYIHSYTGSCGLNVYGASTTSSFTPSQLLAAVGSYVEADMDTNFSVIGNSTGFYMEDATGNAHLEVTHIEFLELDSGWGTGIYLTPLVNTMVGGETNKAPSVAAVTSYVTTILGDIEAALELIEGT